MLYEFMVLDDEGFWGDVRQEGETAEQARCAAKRWLYKNETRPLGSLGDEFRLINAGANDRKNSRNLPE